MKEEEWSMDNETYRRIHENGEAVESFCVEILQNARNELYLNMHFFDLALSSFSFAAEENCSWIRTDGFAIYYQPGSLLGTFKKGRIEVNRALLHILLHCLFCHPDTRNGRERKLWNIACDIAVELMMDGMNSRCIHRAPNAFRRSVRTRLQEALPVLNAQQIWQYLKTQEMDREWLLRLEQEFYVDFHDQWEEPPKNPKEKPRQKRWEDIREKLQTQMETYGKEAAQDAEALQTQVQIANRKRYDYKEFLRKFMVLREEMQIDTDSFDYIYYTYGMELYGNVPLMEPLETKEVKAIEDFVIVIDTSMSCSGELVKTFLEQTYAVLSESESFFRKIHIRILQCDDRIRMDTPITNRKELELYMEHAEIIGQGGTDFRPAFEYVSLLLKRREFHKLRGMIYFTDGYGRFPLQMPPYETAFVFMKEDYSDVDVPPWAIKLIVQPEQFQSK